VNDDGVPEVVNADLEIMSGDYARITRLSVYDWNGKTLWRLGEKREGKLKLTSDVAFNAGDVDGDGTDEVMAGYSMLAADGTTLWTVPGSDPDRNRFPGPEHADSVLVERFGLEPDAPIRIAIAASDMGFLLLDTQGHLLAQHRIGHAQSLAAGRFRPDLPGRQFLVRTQWGNQNIANLFDYDGNLLLIREDAAGGLMPVNWLGDGGVLAGAANALFDGNFDRVVEIGGGGSVRPTALDVNNDGLDEVLAIRGNVITVYASQGVKPIVPAPKRNLTNYNGYGGFFF
jgi:hypothetical protein